MRKPINLSVWVGVALTLASFLPFSEQLKLLLGLTGVAILVVCAVTALWRFFQPPPSIAPPNDNEPYSPPEVVLLPSPGQLNFHNRGKGTLRLWGTKVEGLLPSIETTPRELLKEHFYYIHTNLFEARLRAELGSDGEKLVPLEAYFADQNGKRYIGKFAVLVKIANGNMTLHTQNLGMEEGDWLSPPNAKPA